MRIRRHGSLRFGSRRIPYRLHKGHGKRLRIVVSPHLAVDVYAPAAATEDMVLPVLRRRAPWICRALDRAASLHPLPCPKRYVSGETFMFLGRQYRLRIAEGRPAPARLYGRFMEVTLPAKTARVKVRQAIERWYAARAAAVFAAHMAACQAIGARHGIPAPRWLIRRMRTRWGSCTPAGRITLNVHLLQTPVHCIDYVIMHELCHVAQHNHSAAFYRLLNRCMPDWAQRRRLLDGIALPAAASAAAGGKCRAHRRR